MKQLGNFKYSRTGKASRGFLYILSLGGLLVLFALLLYGFITFGSSFLTGGKESFEETIRFVLDLEDEAQSLINSIDKMYLQKDEAKLRIYPGGYQFSVLYDFGQLMDNLEHGDETDYNSMESLEPYKLKVESRKSFDITEYDYFRRGYLNQTITDDSILLLDEDAFKSLFEENGFRNKDHCFTDAFSSKAYFIFDFKDSELKGRLLYQEGNKNIDYDNAKYDITEEEYAVYDPEQNVFYSTWDNYFSPASEYVYRMLELAEVIKKEDPDGERYNSILIPLLRCYNYVFSDCIAYYQQSYVSLEAYETYLDQYEQYGGSYYLLMGNNNYGNVKDVQNITDLDTYYTFEKQFVSVVVRNCDGEEIVVDDNWIDQMTGYNVGSILYMGFDDGIEGIRPLLQHKREHQFFQAYGKLLFLGFLLCFILFIWLLAGLVKTSGRKYKEDTEVALVWFDRIYSEFWWIIVIVWQIVCVAAGIGLENLFEHYASREYLRLIFAILEMGLPFGFFGMLFTLSFVRRHKAHNWKSNSLIYHLIERGKAAEATGEERTAKGVKRLIRTIEQWVHSLKGTSKLWIIFLLYVFLNLAFAYGFVVLGGNAGLAQSVLAVLIMVYVLLQVLAIRQVAGIIKETNELIAGVEEITKGNLERKVKVNEGTSIYKDLAHGINHISDGLKAAVETSVRDERMKTELITNVSHDLKTPLTSIINYITLLKTEQMPTKEAEHYVEVLDGKAQRLKQLTEDLVEAAKATSGNIELEMMPLAFDELMKQALGEFEDKFMQRDLDIVAEYPSEKAMIMADGRRIFRVIENVLQNAYKYALEGTRIYAELSNDNHKVTFTLKNVSAAPLNISPEELMERFTRGDASRTTEGSGLGLSIAKDLTRLQEGIFDIILDGDLFKVVIQFDEWIGDDK